jgi:hypothetical protein
MEWFTTHGADLWSSFATLVTVASIWVKVTPSSFDNQIVDFLQRLIQFVALNKGK